MVDHQIHRDCRVNSAAILAFTNHFGTDRSHINYPGHTRKILHQHARRLERNVLVCAFGIPVDQCVEVLVIYGKTIVVSQHVFQKNPDGEWQFFDGVALALKRLEGCCFMLHILEIM